MDPFELMTKSAGGNYASAMKILNALRAGSKATYLQGGINHANKIVKNYAGNKGMGWRVDMANKHLAKNTGRQAANAKVYDDFVQTLTPGQQTAMRYGRNALSVARDIPRSLAFMPSSRMGFLGSTALYTGAGLAGLNIDPYNRVGQLHGLSNAKDIATEYGTQGGYQGANDLLSGFDSLGMRDRMSFASNPNAIRDAIPKTEYNPSGSNFNLNRFLAGNPDMIDNAITSGIAKQVNDFKI